MQCPKQHYTVHIIIQNVEKMFSTNKLYSKNINNIYRHNQVANIIVNLITFVANVIQIIRIILKPVLTVFFVPSSRRHNCKHVVN